MDSLGTVIRRESTLTLLREAAWRAQKRWKRMRFQGEIELDLCPVQYQSAGYYRPTLEVASETAVNAIVRYSDLVCSGYFSWFGYGPVLLGLPPRWNFDFVAGQDWPQLPAAAVRVMRQDGSDVKVPWELSRLQFLPVMGKAWRLTQQACYRDAAKDLLGDWIEQNPVGVGVNWVIAMEAALRAMSICFFLELVSPFSPEEQSWLQSVTRSLWEHLLFIEAHNEFSHFARSNHYLSNIVGLLCLSASLSGPRMEVRHRRYQTLVEREICCQVYDDGGDYEASTGYHLLATQMFTSALLVMRAANGDVSPAFRERLRRMFRLLACLADARGRIPQVGDCDDGRVELLTHDLQQMITAMPDDRHALNASSLLGMGGCLLGENFEGRADDAFWYGLAPELQAAPSGTAPAPYTQLFRSSGIAVVRRGDAELFFFALPNGIQGKGSHTHNDKLSTILRIRDQELFSDCGTFCYSRDPVQRNLFRSTLAHNTVKVDREEQNRFSDRCGMLFRMRDDAQVSAILCEEMGSATRFSAQHDGYRRLNVTHRRSLTLEDEHQATVEDCIIGAGEHTVEAAWHLPGTWQVRPVQDRGPQVECVIQGPFPVEMTVSCNAELDLKIAPVLISRAYGTTSTGTTIIVSGRSALPLRLLTRLSWEGI